MPPDQPASPGVALDFCSISVGARLLGDRWTLMVVREMLCGARRFNDIHRRMPTLSRSMLAGRLRNLERMGALRRVPVAGTTRHEYALTPAGEALRDVLESVGGWAHSWPLASPDAVTVPSLLVDLQHSLHLPSLPQAKVCIEFRFSDSTYSRAWLRADRGHVRTCVDSSDVDIDLIVNTRPQVLDDLWHGRRTCEPTIASGDIRFEGPGQFVRGFGKWFRPAAEVSGRSH